MLSTKDKRIIRLIVEHCLTIESVVSDLNKEQFENNTVLKNSVCFDVLQIGELAKFLSDEFILIYNQVPWKNIKGMRDWVAHGYHRIEMNKVWKTAVEDIKTLKDYCELILQEN